LSHHVSHSVLIVEDEPDLRRLLSVVCERAGYEVVTAENGKVGLDAIKTRAFDLVVSDIRMPEFDGLELLQQIRGPLNLKVPVIILTGHRSADEEEAMALGASCVLHKPCTPQTILKKMGEFLT